jgi:integrase
MQFSMPRNQMQDLENESKLLSATPAATESSELQSVEAPSDGKNKYSPLISWLNTTLRFSTSAGRPASDNTLDAYSRSIKRLLEFSGKAWNEITPADFVAYLTHRATQVSHNSVAADDRNLRAVFALANKDVSGQFRNFACSTETLPRRLRSVRGNKTKLSADQAKRLLDRASEIFSFRDLMILRVMLMAGLRVSEVANAKRSDFHHNALFLTRTKGSKPRVVYLPKKLQDQIKDWLKVNEESEYLFASAGGIRVSRRAIHAMVARAGRLIHVASLSPHSLRRTYGSIAHSRGAPLKFLQQQFGHADIRTTMEYIDIDAETSREIANEYCEL